MSIAQKQFPSDEKSFPPIEVYLGHRELVLQIIEETANQFINIADEKSADFYERTQDVYEGCMEINNADFAIHLAMIKLSCQVGDLSQAKIALQNWIELLNQDLAEKEAMTEREALSLMGLLGDSRYDDLCEFLLPKANVTLAADEKSIVTAPRQVVNPIEVELVSILKQYILGKRLEIDNSFNCVAQLNKDPSIRTVLGVLQDLLQAQKAPSLHFLIEALYILKEANAERCIQKLYVYLTKRHVDTPLLVSILKNYVRIFTQDEKVIFKNLKMIDIIFNIATQLKLTNKYIINEMLIAAKHYKRFDLSLSTYHYARASNKPFLDAISYHVLATSALKVHNPILAKQFLAEALDNPSCFVERSVEVFTELCERNKWPEFIPRLREIQHLRSIAMSGIPYGIYSVPSQLLFPASPSTNVDGRRQVVEKTIKSARPAL